MRPATLFCLLLLTAGTAHAQEKDFPGIEKLMSAEDYRAAGLDKLSPAELAALDRWLLSYTAGEAQALRQSSEEVQQAEQDIQIETRIKGEFRGWSGNTVFALDNGQLWRQRLEGRFAYNGDDRRVIIEKNFFGYFRLTHVATGRSIGVSRVTR